MNEIAIRKRALRGDRLLGTFLNTGSAILTEIAGRSGLDWCLLDMEHGSGSWEMLANQLMALDGTGSAPIVRLPSINLDYFKSALDLGAHGLMLPNLNTVEEARDAVSFSRYPPHGTRGVSIMNRSTRFGVQAEERLKTAHENTLIIAQIESPTAVENVDEIAAVDGIDVLFVGPMDLSVTMGIARQFDHPDFIAATSKVIESAQRHHKACGILGFSVPDIADLYAQGYTFIAVGSELNMVAKGMNELVAANREALNP